jgi:hypothetical protein
MSERRLYDEEQDRQVEESFPASDPPSTTPTTGVRRGSREREAGERAGRADEDEARPKANPTDDRHAHETTAGRIEGVVPPEHKTK